MIYVLENDKEKNKAQEEEEEGSGGKQREEEEDIFSYCYRDFIYLVLNLNQESHAIYESALHLQMEGHMVIIVYEGRIIVLVELNI